MWVTAGKALRLLQALAAPSGQGLGCLLSEAQQGRDSPWANTSIQLQMGLGCRAYCYLPSDCKGHVSLKAKPALGASECSVLGPSREASGITSRLCCFLVTSHRSLPNLLEQCPQDTASLP